MDTNTLLMCVGGFFILFGLYGLFNKNNKLWGITAGIVEEVVLGKKEYVEKTTYGEKGETTEYEVRQSMTVRFSYTVDEIYDFENTETRDKSEFPPFMRLGTKTKIAYRKDDPTTSQVFYGSNTDMRLGGAICLIMGLTALAAGIVLKFNLIH